MIPAGLSSAVSETDCTELAFEATGTCACNWVALPPGAAIVHEVVWLPAPQSVLEKAGITPEGCAERVIVTRSLLEGVQLMLHTLKENVPDWPRVMLVDGWVTLMHKMGAVGALTSVFTTTAVRVASVTPPAELADGEPVLTDGEPEFGDWEVAEDEPVAPDAADEEGACELGVLDGGADEEGDCEADVLSDGDGAESDALEDT